MRGAGARAPAWTRSAPPEFYRWRSPVPVGRSATIGQLARSFWAWAGARMTDHQLSGEGRLLLREIGRRASLSVRTVDSPASSGKFPGDAGRQDETPQGIWSSRSAVAAKTWLRASVLSKATPMRGTTRRGWGNKALRSFPRAQSCKPRRGGGENSQRPGQPHRPCREAALKRRTALIRVTWPRGPAIPATVARPKIPASAAAR